MKTADQDLKMILSLKWKPPANWGSPKKPKICWLITMSPERIIFTLSNQLPIRLSHSNRKRYTTEMGNCAQVKLLFINSHTTAAHENNTGIILCLGVHFWQNPLMFCYCLLSSYQEQSEILPAPPTQIPSLNSHISGRQALLQSRTEQCWHVQHVERWTEWKKEQEEPQAMWRLS